MARLLSAVSLVLLAVSLAGCGGDGDGKQPAPTPAPSGLSYPAAPLLTRGTPITPLVPAIVGTATSYKVSPALPTGLSLNAGTGVISGTPAVMQPLTEHEITATNGSSFTIATILIEIRDAAPAIQYPRAAFFFAIGVPIRTAPPVSNGGAVQSWAIDPAPPAGISFDSATGRLGGTPTTLTAPTPYLVTATNGTGSSDFNLTIGVGSGVLFDLGHASAFDTIDYDGSRILSVDVDRRAVLWNAQSGARVRVFDSNCDTRCGRIASLAAQTAVFRDMDGFEIRSATDGALIAQVDAPVATSSDWRLATDGSYFVVHDAHRITTWSNAGTELFSRSGNYCDAETFTLPGEIRVARGAAGADVIEALSVPSGASTVSASFVPPFHSWFEDGGRFFANGGYSIYSADGTQIGGAAKAIAGRAGYGDWHWNTPEPQVLHFHHLSTGSYFSWRTELDQHVHASGSLVAVLSNSGRPIVIFDLSQPELTPTEYPPTFGWLNAFESRSSNDWLVGTKNGVLLEGIPAGAPRSLSYGAATSIASSPQRVAVATSSARILTFDAVTQALEGEIPFSTGKVLMSSDGGILAARVDEDGLQSPRETSARVFELPSRNLLSEWFSSSSYGDLVMSAAGNRIVSSHLSHVSTSPAIVSQAVFTPYGTNLWNRRIGANRDSISHYPLRPSPSGARFAGATSGGSGDPGRSDDETALYSDSTLVRTVEGWPVGWLDDSRLLINLYEDSDNAVDVYAGCRIVNVSGEILATPPLPELQNFQVAGLDQIYLAADNVILDALTGNTLWLSPSSNKSAGSANADQVFFASGPTVRAESR